MGGALSVPGRPRAAPVPDAPGSVRAVTDASGDVVQTHRSDAWGAPVASSGGSTQPYHFTGEPRDDEAGLVFLRARYDDPALGRFLSRDSFGGTSDSPGSLHRYAYAHNNPVTHTDPSGHCLGPAVVVCGAGALGVLEAAGAAAVVTATPAVGVAVTVDVIDTVRAALEPDPESPALEVDPETGKPIRRVYEANPKHKAKPYTDSRGRVVSKAPVDGEGALERSEQTKPTSPERIGVDPTTGERVVLRRHLRQEFEDEIVERYHGFVP